MERSNNNTPRDEEGEKWAGSRRASHFSMASSPMSLPSPSEATRTCRRLESWFAKELMGNAPDAASVSATDDGRCRFEALFEAVGV